VEASFAFGPPAADPLVGGGAGYTHLSSDVRDRPTGLDAFDQDPPAMNRQPGITVRHEDLRARCSLDTSTTPEVFVMIKT
jgi:hypothetical protein